MTPIVDGLESEFAGQATVLQLNADDSGNARLLQQYGLRGHPSFVVLDADGRPVQTFVGPQTEAVLREALTVVALLSG
jgi:thioredoxin-like negative regulator of GroEL